jgi:transglutaminase-like putative cysteine protease
MQRAARVLALILLLSAAAAAQDAPQLATSLSAEVLAQGTVSASGGTMRDLRMNISVPSSEAYQIVEAGEQMLFDAEGNAYLSIHSANPPNPFAYSKKIAVQSVARTTQSLPESYSVPSDYKRFTAATNRTQSGDAGIRKLAEEITQGAQAPFEKVALLAIYVNRNMDYDETMVGQEKDALWVKENMRGVCTEYATLFSALARSMGIPVRYISGYVYSDRYGGWMGHAWAEAYVGKWVPVDPTWFEVGALDAMHIEETKAAEFSNRDTLSASVSRTGVELEWDTGQKTGALAGNIKTIKADYSQPLSGFDFGAAETSLPFGGSTIAYLSMQGTDYRVVPVSLKGCTGAKSVELDESEKYLVLQPGKTSTLVWEINASSSLARNYAYSCPLTLNSPYLEHSTLLIRADPFEKELQAFEASLQKASPEPGEGNAVLLKVPKQRRGKEFVAVLPDGIYTASANGAASEITFSTSATGSVPVYVAAGGGGWQLLSYSSGTEGQGVSIDSFTLPPVLVAGKKAVAHANVSASSYPADATLSFSFSSHEEQAVSRLSAPQEFAFSFTPSSPGAQAATLTLSSSGQQDSESRLSEVLPQPVFMLDKVQSSYVNGTLYAELSFVEIGPPVSPAVFVAGASHPAEGPVVLALPFGTHPITLSWKDAAGNDYSTSQEITVSQPDVFSAASQPQGCALSASLLAIVLIFAILKR